MLIPSTTKELIELLDTLYPHQCIKKGETIEEAQRRAGARELVDFLIEKQKELEEDGLTSIMEPS